MVQRTLGKQGVFARYLRRTWGLVRISSSLSIVDCVDLGFSFSQRKWGLVLMISSSVVMLIVFSFSMLSPLFCCCR